ncbi:MAG: hypothetical protein PHQ32_03205 [Firmicutes bacterium]|nr:hypothetical protein [Bacillota bacterium]
MAKPQTWKIQIGDITHEVVLKKDVLFNKHKLIIDGTEKNLSNSLKNNWIGIDEPIMIGNKEAIFTRRGSTFDIVIDGFYVDSKKEYKPLNKMAWWSWIFVVLCLLIPLLAIGGILPVLFGISGAVLCVQVSTNPTMKLLMKILLNILITVIAWFCFYVLYLSII